MTAPQLHWLGNEWPAEVFDSDSGKTTVFIADPGI